MAALSKNDRFDIWAEYMQENSEAFMLAKGDIKAAECFKR